VYWQQKLLHQAHGSSNLLVVMVAAVVTKTST